jgi:excisionase family DNA binding protein
MPDLLSLAEAAQILKISRPTLRKRIRGREVSYYQIGRKWFLDRTDVEEFLRQARVEACRGVVGSDHAA